MNAPLDKPRPQSNGHKHLTVWSLMIPQLRDAIETTPEDSRRHLLSLISFSLCEETGSTFSSVCIVVLHERKQVIK